MRKNIFLYLIIYMLSGVYTLAENITHFQIYTTADGLSHRVIHTILQDSKGYLWMATWNGLCQYDGCEFYTYNKLEDGQLIGRINRIAEDKDGNILCLTSQNKCYLFNPASKVFTPTSQIPPKKQNRNPYTVIALGNGISISNPTDTFFLPIQTKKDLHATLHATCTDRNGNLWINCNDVLYKISFPTDRYRHYTHIRDINSPIYGTEIRSFLNMGNEVWLAGKNGKIYVYDTNRNFIGYLSKQGNVSFNETSFEANVYTMMYKYGKIWIASKGNGLYMLTPIGNQKYNVHQWPAFDGDNEIYSFTFDLSENLWIGTYNKGIYKIVSERNYGFKPLHVDTIPGIRHICLINNHIAAASKKGLLIYNQEGTLKQRVSNYDCSYIYTAKNGMTYVATMGFGLYQLVLQDDCWELVPYKVPSIPTETILSITEDIDGKLYFIKDDSFFRVDGDGDIQTFGENYFGQNITFSEAEPLIRNSTLWAGTAEGYLTIDLQAPDKNSPPFYWKEIRVDTTYIPTNVKEIDIIQGQEIKITPIVLDYGYLGKIQYKYRIDSSPRWIPLNEKESIILRNLSTGTHLLELQYTDSKGIWSKDTIFLQIHVRLLLARLIANISIGVISFFVFVICIYYLRKKRSNSVTSALAREDQEETEDSGKSKFMLKAKEYVQQNMSKDDLTVDRLGTYLGMSRSVLYQRMKESINKTPAQFIKDVRIEEAERLLKSQKYTIAEIADITGFCDAKYFGKVFKKETGKVPTSYLKEQNYSK